MAALLLGGTLVLQNTLPWADIGTRLVWGAGVTDVWQPGSAEAREAICIDDSGAEEALNQTAFLRVMSRDRKKIWDLGGSYAYEDLGKRSSGQMRQTLYQNIAASCSGFATNTADVELYKGYYVISVIPLLDAGITLTANEAVETYFMFRSDNPQYYWLSNQVIYSSRDGYVNRLYLAVYQDFISGAVRSAVASEMEAKLDEYVEAADAAGDSRASQVAAIYEKLSREISYSASSDDGWVHTIAGAFGTQGHTGAVCEGFSKVLQITMNALGIPNLFVAGNLTTTGVGHAWNLVQMEDGKYYGLDATWDNGAARGSWTYFLSGTDTFTPNHTPLSSEGTGARFQYSLPDLAAAAFEGAAAENVPAGVIPPENTDQEPVTGLPVINSVIVSDITAGGYTVTADFTAPAGVREVLMPTWTEANGQDDLVWHKAEVSGNKAVFQVRSSDHKGESGNYITHVYVRDVAGNEVLKGTSAEVPSGNAGGNAGNTDNTGNSGSGTVLAITDIRIENVDAQGYKVTASFTSPLPVSEVLMPTWTEAGGQDDLIWHKAAVSGNTAVIQVRTAEHRSEGGKYITHVYVKDSAGNQVLDGRNITVPGAAQNAGSVSVASVWTSDVSSAGYTANVTFTGNVREVLMPTWTEAGGQDDLIWHKASISGNTASFTVKTAEHKGESGVYITHVYVRGADGTQIIAGINAYVPASNETASQPGGRYIHNGTDYSPVFDAAYYLNAYPDLRAAFGSDAQKAFAHFIQYGMREGRMACATFNVHWYRGRYADLHAAFGADLTAYYIHYLQYGIREHRQAV